MIHLLTPLPAVFPLPHSAECTGVITEAHPIAYGRNVENIEGTLKYGRYQPFYNCLIGESRSIHYCTLPPLSPLISCLCVFLLSPIKISSLFFTLASPFFSSFPSLISVSTSRMDRRKAFRRTKQPPH